ncbi:MAG: siroheme synthase CysG [Pseudomonadota bacterium]
MRHFPVFMDLRGRRVIISGAGETAVAKLRLLLKTEATIAVYGVDPVQQVRQWAEERRIALFNRPIEEGDAICAAMLYGANDAPREDARAVAIGRRAGAITNIVDNLEDSQFITPAIVDRDPVTVAIGTEGAAPVLARKIKADLEERLPSSVGLLARIGQAFRPNAEALPMGRARRRFWSRFYFEKGPRALADNGQDAAHRVLEDLLAEEKAPRQERGHVSFVGAGPGDPELLTLKARRVLHEADVVIHDRLASPEVLELARREAKLLEVGKTGFGPSWRQADIDALIIAEAQAGHHVVRLKSGDPSVFGRLDEEISALDATDIPWEVVPGITAASAAAADLGASLTRRGRNAELRVITGHDASGFAEHDWRDLAKPGAVAAIYMGLRASTFIRGRLLMHGADPDTPVTAVENASRADRRIVATRLADLPEALAEAGLQGPAVLMLGLAPHAARQTAEHLKTDPETHALQTAGGSL